MKNTLKVDHDCAIGRVDTTVKVLSEAENAEAIAGGEGTPSRLAAVKCINGKREI